MCVFFCVLSDSCELSDCTPYPLYPVSSLRSSGSPGMVRKGWIATSACCSLLCGHNVATTRENIMAGADAVVRARIDLSTKQEATMLFRQMGITVSDAIRMMLVQAVAEKALPFEVRVPNAETVAALQDSRNGIVTRAASVDDLFAEDDED